MISRILAAAVFLAAPAHAEWLVGDNQVTRAFVGDDEVVLAFAGENLVYARVNDIVVGTQDGGDLYEYDWEDGEWSVLTDADPPAWFDSIHDIDITPDGDILIAGSEENFATTRDRVYRWNLATGEYGGYIIDPHPSTSESVNGWQISGISTHPATGVLYAYVVKTGLTNTTDGFIYTWTPVDGWTEIALAEGTDGYNSEGDMDFDSSGTLWIVMGQSGLTSPSRVYSWTQAGGMVNEYDDPDFLSKMHSISIQNENDVFVVGELDNNGIAVGYQGNWTPRRSPPSAVTEIDGLSLRPLTLEDGEDLYFADGSAGVYRWDGLSWGSSEISTLTGSRTLVDIALDGDDIIGLYGSLNNHLDRVHRYSNGSWDSGFRVPTAETLPTGVIVDSDGNIRVGGQNTDRIFTYSNGSWDSGISMPSGVITPQGLGRDGDDILLSAGPSIYRYSNGSWDSGINRPSTALSLRDVDAGGNDLIAVSNTAITARVYRYSNGSWDSGFLIPPGNSVPRAISVVTTSAP